MNKISLFNFAWFYPNFQTRLNELAELALSENWNYTRAPAQNGLPILFNYIHHTFNKIHDENQIQEENEQCIFNTGLVTTNQEGIFAYFDKNKKVQSTIPWYFIGWRKESHRDLMNLEFYLKRQTILRTHQILSTIPGYNYVSIMIISSRTTYNVFQMD